ncbi:MAG TPA: molybdopterin-binding protein [Hyphomicrobiales bacterium]|nr:molybdopterin-binding protein [Hyphomicrobiales bacterium]
MAEADSAAGRIVTAGLVVIGDEVLSGRTKDRNTGYIAEYLTNIGIDLVEVRIVGDREDAIVEAVNALRARYTYVFTTGGIGPTHDDITADSIGAAFGVPVDVDPRARAILEARYAGKVEITPARLRMARFPAGAEPIANPVSGAPGFRIGNVYVMAGVPAVMQAMLDEAAGTLSTGRRMLSRTIELRLPEGAIGDALAAIQKAHPGVLIGSYPSFDETGFLTRIVLRARDESLIAPALVEVAGLDGKS